MSTRKRYSLSLALLLVLVPAGTAVAEDEPKMGWETIHIPTTAVVEREGKIRFVSLSAGSNRGLARGHRGRFLARYDRDQGRDHVKLGWIEILSVSEKAAEARVTLDDPKSEIRVGDVAALTCWVPRLGWRSPLWTLTKKAFLLEDFDWKPFFEWDDLALRDSRKQYDDILERMVADIRRVGGLVKKKVQIEKGRYAGQTLIDVLKNVSRADLLAFFDYAETFPGKYVGWTFRVSQTFAAWVVSGAPPGAFSYLDHILAPKDEEERKRRFEALAVALEAGMDGITATGILDGWRGRAMERSERGQHDEALLLTHLSIELDRRLGLKRDLLLSLFRLAYVHSDAGRTEDAYAAYLKGYEAFLTIEDPTAEDYHLASFSLNNAAAQAKMMGRYGDALRGFRDALALYDEAGVSRYYFGNNHRSSGEVLLAMGRADEAVQEFEKAAAVFRETEDPGPLRHALTRVAEAQARLGRTKEATEALERILAAERKAGHGWSVAEALRNLGEHYADLGENLRARSAYEESLDILAKLGEPKEAALLLQKLARLKLKMGEPEACMSDLEESIRFWDSIGDVSGKASATLELGRVLVAVGEFRLGLEAFQEARGLYAGLGASSGERDVIGEMVTLLWEKREYRKALALQDRLVALYEADEAEEDLAYALLNRGALLDNLREFERARRDLDDALVRFRALKAPYGEGQTLTLLANHDQNRRRWKSARSFLDEALSIFGELLDRERIAFVTRKIGRLEQAQYRYAEAREWLDRALDLYEDPELDTPIDQAGVLNDLAYLELMSGEFTAALETYGRAKDLALASGGRVVALTAVEGIADVYGNLGRLQESRAAWTEALRLMEEVDNDWASAGVYWDLALFHSRLGNTGEALHYNDVALEMWRRLGNEWGEAAILNNRAGTYITRGDVDRGLADLEAGLPIVLRTGDRQLLAAYHASFARAHFAREDYAAALAESEISLGYSRAIENTRFIYEQLERLADTRLELAETGVDVDTHLHATERLIEEALERTRATGARLNEAKTLVTRGRLERLRGQTAVAVATLAEARTMVTGSGAKGLTARVLFESSLALEADGRLEEALAARRQAVTAYEGMRAVLGGGEAAEEKFLRSKIEVYESTVSLLGRLVNEEKDPEKQLALIGEALEFVGRVRFEVLKKGAAEIEGTGSAEVDKVLAKIRAAQKEITRLTRERSEALAEGNTDRAARLGEVITDKQEELAELYLDITPEDRELSEQLSFFDPREIDLSLVPGNPRLLVYFVGENNLFFWVFTRDGFKEWKKYPLGRKELYGLVGAVRDGIREMIDHHKRRDSMGSGFGPEAEKNEKNPEWYRENVGKLRRVLKELHRHVIGPVAGHVEAADPLLILPYGQLNYLPFDALIDPLDPEERFLGTRKRTVYFANEKNMSKTLARFDGEEITRGPDHWVIYADPRGKLVDALEEADSIKGFFPEKLVITETQGDATEAGLADLPAGCTILHFATHGYLNGRPSRTFLELALPKAPGGRKNDGELWAGEVWPRLKKSLRCIKSKKLRLVVLSACDTARGQKNPQAEVLGMPGVFSAAGVPAVVASLWSVYSWTTTDLMVEFYRRVGREQLDLATSLRDARRVLATKKDGRYSHPFYWAPFVLFGDWR